MKANEYNVLLMAVENGVQFGYARAHKHVETPTPDALQTTITDAVMNEICEWFQFEDEEKDDEQVDVLKEVLRAVQEERYATAELMLREMVR
jgi:hypothetical protein